MGKLNTDVRSGGASDCDSGGFLSEKIPADGGPQPSLTCAH